MNAPAPPPDAPGDTLDIEPEHAWQRGVVNAFVLFHLLAIVVWNMPGSYLQGEIKARMTRYMMYVSLDQAWGMFAPEPGRENTYMQARITLADGERVYRPIGRQDNLNPLARLIYERERKMTENLYNTGVGTPYYNQMALWALRKVKTDPKNPPVKVEITRHWSIIPPLPEGIRQSPFSTGWRSDVVHSMGLANPQGKGRTL
jgi:hypothetical protein